MKLFGKRDIVPLRFNEAQLRLYEAHEWFRKEKLPVRIIICKARRAGLSTGVEALMFDDTIRNPNTNSLIVANQLSPSENVLSMCVRFLKGMPENWKLKTSKGIITIPVRPKLLAKYNFNAPSDKMEFDSPLDSRIVIASSKSIDQYLSYDFQNIHATEASRYDNAGELFRALSPTLVDDPHSAQYIESTPNGQSGKGEWFYEQVMMADKRGKTEYGETKLVFIPWHEMVRSFSIPFDDDKKRNDFQAGLRQNERDIMRQFPNVTLEQLKWRRMKLASSAFNMDEEMFDQEYPSDLATAFLTSGTNVFTREAIKRLMANTREPIWVGDIYWGDSDRRNELESTHDTVRRPHCYTRGQAQNLGFASHVTEKTFNNLKVWDWPKRDDRLILSADIGKGNPLTVNGDYSTICVFRMGALNKDELIMTWRGKLNPIAFAEVCAALAWHCRIQVGDKVNKPMLAPEWTGPGSATCTYLDQKNLYEVDRYRMPGVVGMPKSKHIGWESNSKTKPTAVNWMVKMIEADHVDVPSKDVVLEMSSYRQHGAYGDDGDYGGVGMHDDFVSSFQIGCALLRLEATTSAVEPTTQEINLDAYSPGATLDPFDELEPSQDGLDEYGFADQDVDEFADQEASLFY